MANDVFANGREISCKKADGKSICAFPDVCMTPPECPATPPGVPIPYPNTGMAKDTTSGSKKVMISQKEILLKNKSYFKKSMGDEAGCAAKKGVVTSKNRGKVYFTMWSMDVKVEGQNVVRHLDMTTHNHMSVPGNTGPWPYLDQAALDKGVCKTERDNETEQCAQKGYGHKTKRGTAPATKTTTNEVKTGKKKQKVTTTKEVTGDACADANEKPASPGRRGKSIELTKKVEANKCLQTRRCMLQPYDSGLDQSACCDGQTGHHLVEAGSFFEKGRGDTPEDRDHLLKMAAAMVKKDDGSDDAYKAAKAPCICVEGTNQYHGTHGLMHTFQGNSARKNGQLASVPLEKGGSVSLVSQEYGQARDAGVEAAQTVFPESGCSKECLKAQLDAYHNKDGKKDKEQVRAIVTGYTNDEDVTAAKNLLNNGGLKKFQSFGIPRCRTTLV